MIVYAQTATGLALSAPSLSLPIIIGFGLLDSINPCAIGVLLLMLAMLLKTGQRQAIIKNGSAYVIGVYVTYLVGGLTLLSVFNAVRSITILSQIFYVVIGGFVLLAGLLEVKDYFWYGRWFSLAIPQRFIHYVESKVTGVHASLLAAFSFGVLVTLVELPCTGAPYLAILTLMSQSGLSYLTGLPLLLLYNLIFVIPLMVIIYLAYAGIKIKAMENWRKDQRGVMRLVVGLALLAVAVWIITTIADQLLGPLVIALVTTVGFMALIKYLTIERPFEHRRHRLLPKVAITQVEKRNGQIAKFDDDRLIHSIARALHETRQGGSELAEDLGQEVFTLLERERHPGPIGVKKIRSAIAEVLTKHHLDRTRLAYLRHKYH